MQYIKFYGSPLGEILIAADEIGMTGLWFDGQKYFGSSSTYLIFAVICAYFVKGICGFANTVVFTSILSFRSDNINITPVDLLIGIPANIVLTYRER